MNFRSTSFAAECKSRAEERGGGGGGTARVGDDVCWVTEKEEKEEARCHFPERETFIRQKEV